MTALPLPDTLRELAVLVPERVRVTPQEAPKHFWVFCLNEGAWGSPIFELTPTDCTAFGYVPELRLEAALREACEARGWHWTMETMRDGRVTVNVIPDWDRRSTWGHAIADTPAHALALALLAALRGEQ